MTPGAERRTGTQADVFFWQIVLQKVLFALVIKNSPGRRCDLRVKMLGTSSPTDKLTGVTEAAQIILPTVHK